MTELRNVEALRRRGAALALVAGLALLVSGHVLAATLGEQRTVQSPKPSANCQPAREYPDLRIRELEIDNLGGAGQTNAYVVCDMHPVRAIPIYVDYIRIDLHNAGTSAKTVRCNLQDSMKGGHLPVPTRTLETQLAPGTSGNITFVPIGQPPAEGLAELSRSGVQCILPAGTSLTGTTIEFID